MVVVKVRGNSKFLIRCLERPTLTLHCFWFEIFSSLMDHGWCRYLGIFIFSFWNDHEFRAFFIGRHWYCEGGETFVIFGTLLVFLGVGRAGFEMPRQLSYFMWTIARLAIVPLGKGVWRIGFLATTVLQERLLSLFKVSDLWTSGYCLCWIYKSSGNSKIFSSYFVSVTKLHIIRNCIRFRLKAWLMKWLRTRKSLENIPVLLW